MAFVNVVGGNEIYNFHIHRFGTLLFKNLEFLVLKQGLSKQTCVGRALRRDARPRPSAFVHVCRPRPAAIPRPRSFRGPPAPHDVQEFAPAPRAGAPHATCWPDAHPLVRRSGPDPPPSCAVLRPGHHAVVTIGRAAPYLSARPSSSRCLTSLPPFHRAAVAAAVAAAWQAVALHRLWATAHVSSFPRTAAGHCRAPLRQLLRPNFVHLQALGEHVVVPHRFPGRKRGWLAGIRPAPPPPHAKALIANPLVFLGCFL
jgi:hypothetical protein